MADGSVRSNRADVRNPLLALPEVQHLAGMIQQQSPAMRAAWSDAIGAVSQACRAKGDLCWRKHKPPMAAYWKQMAVWFRHCRIALRWRP